MTSCESTSSARQSAPISFAKAILVAWNALSTYFTISATRSGTRKSGAGHATVERGCDVPARGVELTDHGLRRIVEVRDGRALAKELGVHGQAEVGATREARLGFEERENDALGRTGKHGRANEHGVPALGFRERFPDRTGDAFEGVESEAPVARRRRPDANQRELGLPYRRRLRPRSP